MYNWQIRFVSKGIRIYIWATNIDVKPFLAYEDGIPDDIIRDCYILLHGCPSSFHWQIWFQGRVSLPCKQANKTSIGSSISALHSRKNT